MTMRETVDLKMNKIKEICFKLHRAYKYAKQGYHSGDYDYGYLIDDMRFKLRLMAEYLHKHGIAEESGKVVKQLLKFRVMLFNLGDIDSFIGDKYDKILDEKYGEYDFIKSVVDGKEFLVMKRKKINENPDLKDEYFKEAREYLKKEKAESKKYQKKVMAYFLKHYRTWWD